MSSGVFCCFLLFHSNVFHSNFTKSGSSLYWDLSQNASSFESFSTCPIFCARRDVVKASESQGVWPIFCQIAWLFCRRMCLFHPMVSQQPVYVRSHAPRADGLIFLCCLGMWAEGTVSFGSFHGEYNSEYIFVQKAHTCDSCRNTLSSLWVLLVSPVYRSTLERFLQAKDDWLQ